MKTWWNSLATLWKVVIIVGALVALLFIYDAFTGGISNVKSWWNNKQYEQTMAQVQKLEDENKALRTEKAEYEKEAAARTAKDAVYGAIQKDLDAKGKAEVAKLNEALAAQDKEEAVTAENTDAYTRCERVKAKMIAVRSNTAKEIDCNVVKK